MIENFEVLCHSAIKLEIDGMKIYSDPYLLKKSTNDADYILITHSHYDHFSPDDILKVRNDNTIIIITEDLYVEVLKLGFKENNIVIVEPENKYKIKDLCIETINAYNEDKKFHPKENGWVGYIIDLEYERVYIAGDTDATKEAKSVKCDLAFLPVGGTYTMDYAQAAKLANILMPTIVVPMHYGSVVGSSEDAKNFKCLLNSKIHCKIFDI